GRLVGERLAPGTPIHLVDDLVYSGSAHRQVSPRRGRRGCACSDAWRPSSRSRSTGQTRGTRGTADATYRSVALSCLPFELVALPMGCVGRGCVGAVQKRHEHLLWIACRSNRLVRQHELAELLVPTCLGWLN